MRRPLDQIWLVGLKDVGTPLVVEQQQPRPRGIAIRLGQRLVEHVRRSRLVTLAGTHLDHPGTVRWGGFRPVPKWAAQGEGWQPRYQQPADRRLACRRGWWSVLLQTGERPSRPGRGHRAAQLLQVAAGSGSSCAGRSAVLRARAD